VVAHDDRVGLGFGRKGSLTDVKSASGPLRPYQVLATIVGLNLIFVFTAAIAQRATDDTSWWNQNEGLILVIDQVHGLLFMILLVLIALLATRNKWAPWFTISTMLLATIPFVSFWAERRTTRKVHGAAVA
jgi:integral membrane protein